MLRALLSVAVLSVVAASAANANEILVPGDTPFLQQAIDLANPGDVIRVQWANSNGIVTIDKPLTILGEPVCNMDIGCFGAPAIQLAGPGSGTVVLHGIRADANPDCAQAPTQIVGGGFSELHMYDCVVRTPTAGQTGYGSGGHGMQVSVPFLLLVDCTVTASGTSSDSCSWPFAWDSTPYAGVIGPNVVMALDSTVTGGSPTFLCCDFCGCASAPANLGNGGPGIAAGTVFEAGSTIAGGSGADFVSYATGSPVVCATYADGPPVTGALYSWADDAGASSATISLGQPWTISWNLPSPSTYVYMSFDAGAPYPYGAEFVGLGPAPLPLLPLPAGGPLNLTVIVSTNPGLAGLEFGLQFLKSDGTLSRPVWGVHVP